MSEQRFHWRLLLPVFGTLMSLAGCSGGQAASTPAQVVVAKPHATTPDVIHGTCVLKATQTVRLKAQVGGQIQSVLVDQGTTVQINQLLATINVDDLKLRRQRVSLEMQKLASRAELLRFQIARAEKEYSVVDEISNNNAAKYFPKFGKEMAVLQERRQDLRENEINQATNDLELRTIDSQIRKAEIRAPFAGVILTRNAEPGMVTSSASEGLGGSDVLFEVANPAALVAFCIVKESDALAVKNGMQVKIIADGIPDAPVLATISKLSPTISTDSGLARRSFHADISASSDTKLLPGMNAEVLVIQ